MHNMEEQITHWRKSIAAKIPPTALEEIESHLRETIAAHVKNGLTEADAFQEAVEQIGSSAAISREYEKLTPSSWWPMRAAIWTTIVVALGLCALYLMGIRRLKLTTTYQDLMMVHILTITIGYSMTYILGGLGICYFSQHLYLPTMHSRSRAFMKGIAKFSAIAAVFTVIGIILGAIWAHLAWGAAWRWDQKEIGGILVLGWLIFFTVAVRLPNTTPMRAVVFTLIGNFFVTYAWTQTRMILFALATFFMMLGLLIPLLNRRKQIEG
jgi:hypothetical protein